MKKGDIVMWQYKIWKQHGLFPLESDATLFSEQVPELANMAHFISSVVCYWRIKELKQPNQ